MSRELDFANNPKEAIETSNPKGAWGFLIFTILLFAAGLWWASWATVEQVTNGLGTVIPTRQIQVVESLESGTIREILVSEGDLVELDQPLLRIDDTSPKARLDELQKKYAAFSAELMRLEAQAVRAESFTPDLSSDEPIALFLKDQIAVFNIEKQKLRNTLAVFESQKSQKLEAVAEITANRTKQENALALAERELELSNRLFKKKAIPELEYLKIQRLVSELRGDLEIIDASSNRITAEAQEADALIAAEISSFVATASDRIAKVNAELSITEEGIKAARDRVERTIFPAPVSGIVNKLHVATIGEVVQSGATLLEIVPADDQLQIEAKIRPQDIAFVHPGLPATIRLTAYDYTRFGTLVGKVERISADTITYENRETFYKVIITTEENQALPEEIKIIPGLVAEVDISTGKRTVLDYILKPITKIKDQAFRDPR